MLFVSAAGQRSVFMDSDMEKHRPAQFPRAMQFLNPHLL